MTENPQQLIALIQSRMNNRIEMLDAIAGSPMDSIPDDVKKMRELESCKIRAVLEEQKDLIEIIKVLFPSTVAIDAGEQKNKPGRKR